MQLSWHIRLLSVATLFMTPSLFAAKDGKSMDNPRIAIVHTNKLMPTQNAFNMETLAIDLKAVSGACDEWREAFEKLHDTLQSGAEEFNKAEAQFKEKEEELTKLYQSGLSSESVLRERAEKELMPLDRKRQAMRQQRQFFAQSELTNAHGKIEQKIRKIIENLAKDHALKLVLPGEFALWAAKELDLTDDVLKTLNKGYAEEKSKKTSAAPAKSATK